MTSKVFVGWVDLADHCTFIAHQILIQDEQPDYIVGITRGGLIPAVMISHITNIPVVPVSYSAADGAGEFKGYNNTLPSIHNDFMSGSGEMPPPPSLLIVDDIVDTGHTLNEVVQFYEKLQHPITTASIYFKNSSIFQPDIYCVEVAEDSGWIVFPWER